MMQPEARREFHVAGSVFAAPKLPAGLYLVATPIGNLGDISIRALQTLAAADLVACEDTRVSRKLLSHYGIAAALALYHEHNAQEARPKLLARIAEGAAVALISDAGTPLISDPGFKLVREAVGEGLPIHVVPGASAVMAGLAIAGLPTDRFYFAGFLPVRAGERRSMLAELKSLRATLVFFESAQRLADSLGDIASVLGVRTAAVGREMTKMHEEMRRGLVQDLADHYAKAGAPKGEVTLLISPPHDEEVDFTRVDALLDMALPFMPLRAAVDLVADAMGAHRRDVYERALAKKKDDD